MAANSLPQPHFVHLADVAPRSALFSSWERVRHREAHWLVECIAEFMGVFFYVFAGLGSTAAFVLGSFAGLTLSSVFQVGLAYAIGVVLAMVICSSTSGGHFNPAITISFVITKKFPPLKALRYIVAQILGSFIACLIVYVQYQNLISQATDALKAADTFDEMNFSPEGPAGIFGLYLLPGSNLGQVFLNEFVCCFVIGLVNWAILDPTNFAISPVMAPWIIALTYAIAIWGYSPVGIAANSARDVGGRLAAMVIWGRAANGGKYAAIAALTNIPATLCGAMFYEFIFADSSRVITPAHAEFVAGHKANEERRLETLAMNNSSLSFYDAKAGPQVA